MFHDDNGNAMSDGINVSSKGTNIYKNAVKKACLTGKKKKKRRKEPVVLVGKHDCVKLCNGKAEYLLSIVWSLRCRVPSRVA